MPKNAPKRNNPFKILLIIALLGAGLTLLFPGNSSFFSQSTVEDIPLTGLLEKYGDDELKTIKIKDNQILAESFDGAMYRAFKEPSANVKDLGLSDLSKRTSVEVIDTSGGKIWINILIGVAPFILLVLFLVFISRRASSMGGGEGGPFGFGKSRAKVYDKTKHSTKFTDVAGAYEAKDEVEEVVDFLKNPKKYQKMGAKTPKGILLVGAPGTGKTLLARAIAGEADVPFFSVSGSEFVEMFVGVGASRVRDLFKTAKRNAPAIIFIDEIDAIGKHRGQGVGGGHDEREQTLNQILTEMDGFESGTNLIVIAATNRPDVLDKALLRPGRFDRRVHIDMPDMEARLQILTLHAKNKTLAPNTNLQKIASKTVGFSGADLENLLNEAAISAVKARQKNVSQEDLENAVEKVSMGPERRSRRITDSERNIIAHHEVGHAIAGHFCETSEPVHKVSIISRGMALGVTWFLPEEDKYLMSEQKMQEEMVSLHGGRIAERLIFGQTTSGASNDLERISRIARSMVMTYGMGDRKKVGPVVFSEKSKGWGGMDFHEKDFSEETARAIDEDVQHLILEAESKCEEILKKNLSLLKKIATDLLKKENISREEFLAYFKEKPEK
ncbi:ATP-dependent zinc metalloprotease FtsH [Candidatus Gracilibacteria bacterium]|nr:ATP-dependent zinc metalloprotease FtsH [Candidatus Gracilibacteria bacterium]